MFVTLLLPLLVQALPAPLAAAPPALSPRPEPARPLDPRVVPPHADDAHDVLSYTYLEVGAATAQLDALRGDESIDEDQVDSYFGTVSLDLFGPVFVYGTYENREFDYEDTTADLFHLGAGLHLPLLPDLDLVGTAEYLLNDVSSDLDELDDSKSGYALSAGGRWLPVRWFGGGLELEGAATWVSLDNRLASEDRAFGWRAGARLHFLKFLSVGASYAILEEDDEVLGSVRLSF